MDHADEMYTDEDAGPDPRLFVASVARALRILESFDGGRRTLTIAEISQATGLGRSATQRFVYTLHQLGYLRRDGSSKHYRVSAKAIDLALSLIGSHTYAERVAPVLDMLAQKTGETVAWVERDDIDIVILRSIPSKHLSSVNLPVGQRFAALSASSGQVLLAHAPIEEILRVYKNSMVHARERFGLSDNEGILRYFEDVRRRGLSITEKMEDVDSISLSAPVFAGRDEPVGAINISTLKSRFSKLQAERKLSVDLIAAAREASQMVSR